MEVKQTVNLHNKFEVVVTDGVTGNVKQKAEGYNIILDQLYTRVCSQLRFFRNIHFGTGVGTTVPTRTSLFNHLGTKLAVKEEYDLKYDVSKITKKIVLAPEEYVGSEISEVGIAFDSGSTQLVTHALLQDSEGNVITITKTSTDVVTIYATVFITIPTGQGYSLTNLDSNSLMKMLTGDNASIGIARFDLKKAPNVYAKLGVAESPGWINDIPGRKLTTQVTRFGIDVGNGPVGCLTLVNICNIVDFNPGGQTYTDVSLGMGDGVITDFVIPSLNFISGSEIIKQNGVAVTNYTAIEDSITNIMRGVSGDHTRSYATKISTDGTTLATIYGDGNSPFDINIYDIHDGTYMIKQKVKVSARISTLAINGDGSKIFFSKIDTILGLCVGLLERDGDGLYTERDPLPQSFTNIGASVIEMATDVTGNTVIVGTYDAGPLAVVFSFDGSTWSEVSLGLTGGLRIAKVGVSGDGQVLVLPILSPYTGIKIFRKNGAIFEELPELDINYAIHDVAVSYDGSYFTLAMFNPVIYKWDGAAYQPYLVPGTEFPTFYTNPSNVAIDANGETFLYSTPNKEDRLYTVTRSGDVFSMVISDFNPTYPSDLSITGDGTYIYIGNGYSYSWEVYKILKSNRATIKFNTPPALNDVITADYTVEGVHKTDQYVIDVGLSIQFGEG